MLLTISSPIGPDRWAVSIMPETQIAEVTLGRDGHCTATPTTDRALTLAELSSISAFMAEREQCGRGCPCTGRGRSRFCSHRTN
jgi:hypothetical protein